MKAHEENLTRDATIAFIKQRMGELGLNQRSLAIKAGCNQDAVRNFLTGKSKNWRADTQTKIMAILSENRVYVLGGIGAGDEVDLIADYAKIINKKPGGLVLIDCKTFVVPKELAHRVLHAWEVKSTWEGPMLRAGDMVWTTEIKYSDFDSYIDSEVLVTTTMGQTYIKKLVNGSEPGKYSLMGVSTHGFMRDIEIAWCAQVAGFIKHLAL